MVYHEWKTRVAYTSNVVRMVERSNTLTVTNLPSVMLCVACIEIIHGTADVITETVISYLTSKAPVTLDISKLASGATDGAQS